MKITITGATGNIGTQLLGKLDFNQHEYTLVTRDAKNLANYAEKGAIIAEGSMLDKSFLTKTLEGCDVYFFLPPPNFGSANMIQEYKELATISKIAAQANNVQRIVHLSTIGGHLDLDE
jgi:uncharacterized protein YbjT (DUF2867 family)